MLLHWYNKQSFSFSLYLLLVTLIRIILQRNSVTLEGRGQGSFLEGFIDPGPITIERIERADELIQDDRLLAVIETIVSSSDNISWDDTWVLVADITVHSSIQIKVRTSNSSDSC